MNQQRYSDRKRYVEEARNSFERFPEKNRKQEFSEQEEGERSRTPGGSFRVRLILAALLFAVFFVIQASGWSYRGISAESIRKKIESSISLPEFIPDLSDLVSLSDSETE